MAIELRPGHLLDQFLERADPAGQSDEGVGAIKHRLLAVVHVADDDQFMRRAQRVFLADEEVRDDAGHMPAGGERRAGEATHQAVAAAAVDEPDALGRERPPERLGRVAEPSVIAGARSAIDADVSNRAHGSSLAHDRFAARVERRQAPLSPEDHSDPIETLALLEP